MKFDMFPYRSNPLTMYAKSKNRFFISIIFIIGIPIFGLCQNYETLLSNIFFHADLSKQDTSILSFFANDRRIVYSSKIEMWKNYKKKLYGFDDKQKSTGDKKPKSDHLHTFAFYKNPFFQPPFGKGFITVFTDDVKGQKKVSELVLTISTYDIAVADSTFMVMTSLFRKYMKTTKPDMSYNSNQSFVSIDSHKSREVRLFKTISFKHFVPKVTLELIILYDRQSYLFIPDKKGGDTILFTK